MRSRGTAAGGCGAAPAAGKNANRTSISVNGALAASFCCDTADRLTQVSSTTAPFDEHTSGIGYDAHGNTSALAGQALVYDAADRHLGTYSPNATSPTSSVVYERDVFDRIIRRTETVGGTVTVVRYGYTGSGDTPDVIMDAGGSVVETVMGLPGGVLLTRDAGGGEVWSYPDVHGSVTATADAGGVKRGSTRVYEPHGNPLGGLPDNVEGDFDFGWLGQHRRGVDHVAGLRPLVQMGG